MKQMLADVMVKLAKNGSCVPRSNVTPAEVMLLCVEHKQNAGGDPIIKLKVVPEDAEALKLVPLEKELALAEEKFADLDNVDNITEEVRHKRSESLLAKIERLQGNIQALQQVQALRNLSPADERKRLMFRYGPKVKKLYPGMIPTLPQDFTEARKIGDDVPDISNRFIMGDPAQVVANG